MTKTLPENKIRHIQKLKSKGLSNRKISEKLHVSRDSVQKYGNNVQKTVTAQNNNSSGIEIEIENILCGNKSAESLVTQMIQSLDTQVIKNMLEQHNKLRKIIVNEIKRRENEINNEQGWSI